MARRTVSSYAVFHDISRTTSIVFYYEGGGADTLAGLGVAEAGYIVDLLRNEKPITYDHSRKRLSTLQPEPVGEEET